MTHSKQKTHHHGNLREALIIAGIDILREGGTGALTLRACAARAGVSHAAPAHHFAGLPGLLSAIAGRGFCIFADCMTAARDIAPPDPHARLLAICEGYLTFGRQYPALLSLMFGEPNPNIKDLELEEHGPRAYQILQDACAPFEPISDRPQSTEIMIWSLIHGYSTLTLANRISGRMDGEPAPGFAEILPNLKLRDQS